MIFEVRDSLIAELGVLVKIAAPGDDLRRRLLRSPIDLRRERTSDCASAARAQQQDTRQRTIRVADCRRFPNGIRASPSNRHAGPPPRPSTVGSPSRCVSLAAIFSLALGIGANTAIFSVLHGVVLNPLAYADPIELMMVWETSADNPAAMGGAGEFRGLAPRTTAPSLARRLRHVLAGARRATAKPNACERSAASGNVFHHARGHGAARTDTLPADDEPGAAGVAVLSDGLWLRIFARPATCWAATSSSTTRTTRSSVSCRRLSSRRWHRAVDIWLSGDRGVPRTFPFGGDLTAVRDSHIIFVLGRLRPDASRQSAQQELSAMMVQLAQQHPETNAGLGVNVVPLHEAVVGNVRPTLMLLQLAVGMMLLIACANVAHLLLGQAAKRQGEIAMRVALGAGRARLVRQMMVETLVIAVPGGLLGLVLARWGLDALVVLAPDSLPRAQAIAAVFCRRIGVAGRRPRADKSGDRLSVSKREVRSVPCVSAVVSS